MVEMKIVFLAALNTSSFISLPDLQFDGGRYQPAAFRSKPHGLREILLAFNGNEPKLENRAVVI